MGSPLCLLQLVLCAADQHVASVFNVVPEGSLETEKLRFLVDDGHHLHAVRGLQGAILVQLVERLPGLCPTLQLNDDAQSSPIRLVPQVRDAGQAIGANQLRYPLEQRGLV